MWLVVVRLGALACALLLLGLVFRRRERTLRLLREFWLAPTGPVNLAALRIVLFWGLFRSATGQNPLWYARLPAGERDPPLGWGFLGSLPFDEGLVSGAHDAFVVASAAALLGAFTRLSVPVSAVLAVYVLGLPNFFAKINHAHHVRVLCALALAASPCGDALSLDRLWKRLRGFAPPSPSSAYTVPVRSAWVLLATTYFFPGFWKLWEAGDLWLTGDALRFWLYSKWAALPDFAPLYRIDRHGWLLALLGIATLFFELGFPFALLNRVTRTFAALSAVGFHLGVGYFMGIHFHAFFPLIVLLEIPEGMRTLRRYAPTAGTRVVEALRARTKAWLAALVRPGNAPATSRTWPLRSALPAAVVGGALVFGQVVTGFGAMSTWPVSVYPTFSGRGGALPRVGSSLRVQLETPGEAPVDLGKKLKRLGPARLKKLLHGLERNDRAARTRQRGRALVALFRHASVELEAGDRVSVYETTWKVLPPGKRKNQRERLVQRFVVGEDGTLSRER
ncbi:MAG TPA: HTTM domain-containing protein [Polyangiaceae bacterium]|nr:HTTM domain-containing protein [Polyangiaceae bacterium]